MTQTLKIKRLKAAQKNQAVKLLSRVFNESAEDMRSSFKWKFNSDGIAPVFFVASYQSKVVGVVGCAHSLPNYCAVYGLAVDSSCREMGIGHALMSQAEDYIAHEWMRDQPGKIFLNDATKKKNPASQFYEKMGYKRPEKTGGTDQDEPLLIKQVNAPQGNP